MSKLMGASYETIVFLSLLALIWGYVTATSTNPDVPAEQKGLVTLVGVLYTLGGGWFISKKMGITTGR